MKRLVVVFALLTAAAAYAQKPRLSYPDSLEQVLKSASDPNKIKVLMNICSYYQTADMDKAIKFADIGAALATKLKLDSDICVFNDYKAETLMYKGDFKPSIILFNYNYQLASNIHNNLLRAVILVDIGTAYEMQSDYTQAQDYFFRALRVSEQINKEALAAICYIDICSVFINQNNYEKSVEYANKVLAYGQKQHKDAYSVKAYKFLGTAKSGEKKYGEAIGYYQKGLQLYIKQNNAMGIATMYGLMAANYVNDHQKQLQLALKAQAMWDKIAPENLYAINNLGNIGEFYGILAHDRTGKNSGRSSAETTELFNMAEYYLNRAIVLAKKTNSQQNVIDLTDSLSSVQAVLGKYKDAYLNLRVHNLLNDSVFSQANKNKIASLEGRHEIELRDKQLVINKLDLANNQKQRWFLIAGLAMLVIVAGLIFYQSNQRRKTNTALSNLNTQLDEANKIKTRFFSILNHDLRAPVANFVSFLHLQQNAPDLMDEESKAAYAKKATASAEGLLDTMEDLLLWSKGQMENFKPAIKPIPVNYLFGEVKKSLPQNSIVAVSFNGPTGMELLTDEHYVKTIMHNLTNNAIKALGNTAESWIEWKAWDEDNAKYLSITDNGPGATEEQLKPLYDDTATMGIKSGLGLHIVRDMAKAIGCAIIVDLKATKGVEIKLKFG